MSNDLLDEWAQELKDSHREQITKKIKTQIKKITRDAGRLIRSKDIDLDVYADDITRCIANISYCKRVLRSMLSDDLHSYKDYLKTCIKQSYSLDSEEPQAILTFLIKYDKTRKIRLKKIKGCLIKKFSKY